MAPESLLSLSTSLFSLPHKFNKILSLKTIIHKPQSKSNIPIIAKSTNSQTPTPTAEIDGTGAAKPTRGDLFLSRQQAMAAAAAVVFSTSTKDNKKPKKKQRVTSNAVASCFGCGAPLHTLEVDAPGFVELGLYELKKKHRQLGTVLCGRCKLLSHGHMVTAVGGNGGYPGGKQFVSAEELRRKLSHLKDEKALIVKLERFRLRRPIWDRLKWELLDQDVLGKVRSTLSSFIYSKLPKVSTVLEMMDKLSKMFESTSSDLNSQKCVTSVSNSRKRVTFSDVIEVFGEDSCVIPFGYLLLTSGDYSDAEVKGKRVSHIENGSKRRIKA
ncbi:hypothetical protein GIB67_036502 [Kingdonia uniflora]|uniref:Uncharacterized protein n=1 Tax=Kingdonia uniflora TaxID=39325 RepID=A0A7J7P7J0_9MAGN|nr:hypothetical protein GIB67_036502 [Kingdonia uniflora]